MQLSVAVTTVGGLGYLRPGPGTWASAAAAIVGWILIGQVEAEHFHFVMIACLLGCTALGLSACPSACARFGRQDPAQVVIDEVAGMFAGFSVLPASAAQNSPIVTVVAVFVLFRVFDIAKPWPVCSLERLPGGLGIMADDLAAGAIAGALSLPLIR